MPRQGPAKPQTRRRTLFLQIYIPSLQLRMLPAHPLALAAHLSTTDTVSPGVLQTTPKTHAYDKPPARQNLTLTRASRPTDTATVWSLDLEILCGTDGGHGDRQYGAYWPCSLFHPFADLQRGISASYWIPSKDQTARSAHIRVLALSRAFSWLSFTH